MKTKSLLVLFSLVTTVLLYTSCYRGSCIKGNDLVTTEVRAVQPFTAISSEGSFDVYIIQDSVFEVTVEAESNLMPYIYTWVKGNTLVIKEQDHHCLNNNFPIRITVRCKDIYSVALAGSGNIIGNTTLVSNSMEVDLSGSGNIDLNIEAPNVDAVIAGSGNMDLGIQATNVEARISGSGNISLWGETNRSDISITGSGNITAYGLIQDICFTTITGSGNVFVFVNELLDVKISGSGSVYYKGNPTVNAVISGSGTVVNQN